MSELCSPKCQFSSLLISDFILISSSILSHPLYFSYFIFFSPYLLKLLSFLSPLFLTTSLISLAFLQRLQLNKDHHPNEELQSSELYEIFFGPPSMAEVREELAQTPQKDPILEPIPLPGSAEEAPIASAGKFKTPAREEVREELLQTPQKDPILEPIPQPGSAGEAPIAAAGIFKTPAMAEVREELHKTPQKVPILGPIPQPDSAGEAPIAVAGKFKTPAMEEEKSPINGSNAVSRSNSLSSYGSMRREREWRRTLAGKLFEERHSGGGGGGEGMDSLWEAHEVDSNKRGGGGRREKGRRGKVDVEEEEDDDESGIQLCCLQALKMSAGKMNLGVGMGRPNLVKISKAIKGFGWLHKSSKKVHNNGDHRY